MLFWLYAWHNKQWKIMCLILCLSGSLYSIIYLILLCCSATNTFFSQFVVLFERRFHYFITQSEPQTGFFFLNVIINWRLTLLKRRICGKRQITTNIIYSLLMKKNLALKFNGSRKRKVKITRLFTHLFSSIYFGCWHLLIYIALLMERYN